MEHDAGIAILDGAVRYGVFLHHDRISTCWNRCTGKDPRGGPCEQRLCRVTGRDPLTDRQQPVDSRIGEADGVAVHLRVVMAGHIDARVLIGRKNPAKRTQGIDGFHLSDGLYR